MNNTLKQLRTGRAKAVMDGTPAPVAFYWDDPELLTDDTDGGPFQIWFNDMIDDWYGISAAMIVEALLNADGRDVLVHLNSPGGMVTEGLSIHSTFKQYAGKVTMRVEGLAASAASFIMLAADEVVIEPNAMVMIHDAWDITIGGPAEHQKALDLLVKVSNNIASMYAGKSGGEAEDWRAAMVEETWYIGQEAVDAGLVDSVADDEAEVPESVAAFGARSRWCAMHDKAPKRAGGKITVRPAALVDTDALATAVAAQKTNTPAPPESKEPETPTWWATLHSGLKGVRQ